MDSFRAILEGLKSESDKLWVVEAVFSEQDNPADDMYSTITTFKTREEADAKASELCSSHGHPFITYRARPFGIFRPYVDFKSGNTVFKCDDEKMNTAFEARIKRNHEFKKMEQKRREAMELQDKHSSTVGTVQHFCRAIYTCYYSSMRVQALSEELSNASDGYDKAFRALCTSYSLNNKLVDDWEGYLEHQLELFNDTHTLPNLKAWFESNRKILEGSKITDTLAKMTPKRAALAIAELNRCEKPVNPLDIPVTPVGVTREPDHVVQSLPVPSYTSEKEHIEAEPDDNHKKIPNSTTNYDEDHLNLTTRFGSGDDRTLFPTALKLENDSGIPIQTIPPSMGK